MFSLFIVMASEFCWCFYNIMQNKKIGVYRQIRQFNFNFTESKTNIRSDLFLENLRLYISYHSAI